MLAGTSHASLHLTSQLPTPFTPFAEAAAGAAFVPREDETSLEGARDEGDF
jgi:hypothetical protein